MRKLTFKIRCSAIGQIMTDPKTKSEPISKTTQTYCQTWVKEHLYGRRKEFGSKFTDKGNAVESAAIELLAAQREAFYEKNELFYADDHITGTPDIVTANSIIDIKASWDCFTFPLFDNELDKGYWWQLQGYMALTGREHAEVVYMLMDTPEDLIEREAKSLAGWGEYGTEHYLAVRERLTYDNVPMALRVKSFDVAADPLAVKAIRDRVLLCRDYINTILP